MKLYSFYSFKDAMTTLPPALLLFIATLLTGVVRGQRNPGVE